MELALRPYVTAGVAVAVASLITATPVATAALDLPAPAVQLTASGVADDLAGFGGGSPDLDSLVSPAAAIVYPIPDDPVGIVQWTVNYAQSQITDAVTALSQGDLVDALGNMLGAGLNIFLNAPENAILGVIDNAVGQSIIPVLYIMSAPITDLAGLLADLQYRIQDGLDSIGDGLGHLGDGVVNWGASEIFHGLDQLIVNAPGDLVVGPVMIALGALFPG